MRILAVLLLATLLANVAQGAPTLQQLSNELAADSSLAAQLDIVEQMRALVSDGPSQRVYVDVTVYALSLQPVFAHEQTMTLLREMLASDDLGETTITAIANQYAGGRLDVTATEAIVSMLMAWHQERGLPDKAVTALMRALHESVPQTQRELALEVLLTRPLSDMQQDRFLQSVAKLLEPEVSSDEKYRALDILTTAAASRELPRAAQAAIYKVADRDPDAAVRVAAWEFLLPRHKTTVKPGDRNYLGSRYTSQLAEPAGSEQPSFAAADNVTRERAVSLLIDYWHPDYPPIFADALISLAANHGSAVSVEKLEELRRANALNDEQLAMIAAIRTDDPELQRTIATIAIPNLAPGSMLGPLEVIATSRNQAERATATRQLLARYPTGPVPMAVADAAYQVMADSDEYDAAAVALVVRGDEPLALREAKFLDITAGEPQRSMDVVQALQVLHDDAGLDFLVRRYANDESLDESFRATIVGMLYLEVRDTGELDPETAASIVTLARSADKYSTVGVSTRLLREADIDVGLSLRLREKDVQWKILAWGGAASLGTGLLAGFILLLLVALPGKLTALDRRQRLAGFGLFLLLGALFIVVAGVAALHSIGHNYMPPPDQAAPYYFATLVVAVLLTVTAVRVSRQASRARRSGREASRSPGMIR